MAKFEMEMEIQGFKLRVKGNRPADFSGLQNQAAKQLTGLLQPPPTLFDSLERKHVDNMANTPSVDQKTNGDAKGKRNSRRRSATSSSGSSSPAITWQHDPAKWGMPKQAWSEHDKALWILYVIKNETNHTQVAGPVIVDVFNDKFKAFGPLRKNNAPRMMTRLKTNQPALAIDDTTKSPVEWFLTDEGGKAAERLVQEAKTATAQTTL